MPIGPSDPGKPGNVDRYIGRKVRERRAELDMTPDELAFATNIDVATLGEIENGSRRMTPAEMIALSEALGVTIEWFFEI